MHPPMPGPFHGSMPSPDLAGAHSARLLDAGFSVLAMLGAAGVWAGATLAGPDADRVAVAKVSCAVLLVTALTGMWLIERSADMPRLGVTILYEAIRRRRACRLPRRAVVLASDEMPARGIRGLVNWIFTRTRGIGGAPAAEPAASAPRDRRAQAADLLANLYQEADCLADTSNDFETAGRRLAAELGTAEEACNLTRSAFRRITQRVVALTEAVRTTTDAARQVTAASVALSEQAFGSQCRVAQLDAQTAQLLAGMEQIESQLRRAGRLSAAAGAATLPMGEAGGSVSLIAAELGDLAVGTLAAVEAMQSSLAEMARQAAVAAKNAQGLSEKVSLQHDLGLGLSHAVTQQGAEIAEVLRGLDEAQAGFITLRAGVEAITRHGAARSAQSFKLREAASRLPSHADALAAMLRSLPDFAPPIGFDP